jgi:hypothetical protein
MLTEGWVYGLDVNSSCIGIGMVEVGTQAWRTQGCAWREGWRTPPLPHSLNACRRVVHSFLAMLHELFPAAAVAIERPSGIHANPSLMAHWGVVTEATFAALDVTPFSYKGAPEWRKALGLPPGKPASLEWAREQGFDVDTLGEDQAEGLAIAAAGMLQLAQPDALALRPWIA